MTPEQLLELCQHWPDQLIGKGFHGIYFVRDLLAHVKELEAEISMLRKANEAMSAACAKSDARIEELEADRRRLDWLLTQESARAGEIRARISSETGVTRAAIDAAIAKETAK